jgi:predicted transcriptional regulator
MSDETSTPNVLGWTAQIVSAHVSNNTVPPEALPGLIQEVFRTLSNVGIQVEPSEKPQPAVPIKKSVFGDYIICLEDGKKLKMLKRHLKTAYNLEPDQYRERWGLPPDYPMARRTMRASVPRSPRRSALEQSRAYRSNRLRCGAAAARSPRLRRAPSAQASVTQGLPPPIAPL